MDTHECPREGCEVERYSRLAVEIHLLRDHDIGPRPVAEVIERDP